MNYLQFNPLFVVSDCRVATGDVNECAHSFFLQLQISTQLNVYDVTIKHQSRVIGMTSQSIVLRITCSVRSPAVQQSCCFPGSFIYLTQVLYRHCSPYNHSFRKPELILQLLPWISLGLVEYNPRSLPQCGMKRKRASLKQRRNTELCWNQLSSPKPFIDCSPIV